MYTSILKLWNCLAIGLFEKKSKCPQMNRFCQYMFPAENGYKLMN
ncbi:hypothetical protein BSM4216_3779 [Bacillus smithii]|nr:hypothetical protein BSM4216_3779 [Bacillus smithii]